MSHGRVTVLAGKAWSFLLDVLRQPSFIPFVAWHVAVRKVHLGELLKVIEYRRWLLGAGIGTLIDVGANKGQFASAIRALLPDVRIFAFEPVPDCHRALAETSGPTAGFRRSTSRWATARVTSTSFRTPSASHPRRSP